MIYIVLYLKDLFFLIDLLCLTIKNIIKNNDTNKETQLKIEQYLYNYNVSTINFDKSVYEYLETFS